MVFAIARNALAEHEIRKQRWKEAEVLIESARAPLVKAYGPSHERVAVAINNLAALRSGEGRWPEAAALFVEGHCDHGTGKGARPSPPPASPQ